MSIDAVPTPTYKIKYNVQYACGEFKNEDLKKNKLGGCDKLLCCYIFEGEDKTMTLFGVDGGKKTALATNDVFYVMLSLAEAYIHSPDLKQSWRKKMASKMLDIAKRKLEKEGNLREMPAVQKGAMR